MRGCVCLWHTKNVHPAVCRRKQRKVQEFIDALDASTPRRRGVGFDNPDDQEKRKGFFSDMMNCFGGV